MFHRVASLLLCLSCAATTLSFVMVDRPTATYVGVTSLVPLDQIPNFADVRRLETSDFGLSFENALNRRRVGNGWETWSSPPYSEGPAPDVLFANGFPSIRMTFDRPVCTFGFEAEPEPYITVPVKVEFLRGGSLVGSQTVAIHGFHGARLLAASDPLGFDEVIVTAGVDFAIARIRYGSDPVPEPATLAALGLGLAALARRRRS